MSKRRFFNTNVVDIDEIVRTLTDDYREDCERTAPCLRCKHFVGFVEGAFALNCAAFGEKPIPDDIVSGRNPHTEPVDGDHGITFAPNDAE